MPVDVTENYIRVRVRDPDDFEDDSFRTITLSAGEGIKAVIGKLKSDAEGSTHVQSYLFDKDEDWTESKATKWVKDHEKAQKALDAELPCEGCVSSFDPDALKFVGSPRNKYGTHASKGYKGGRDAWKRDWRIYLSQVSGGATAPGAMGPLRGTVRRIAMIAAAMKPECSLPTSDDIKARTGAASPLEGQHAKSPKDYSLSSWAKPSDDDLTQEDIQLTCDDLKDLMRAVQGEVKRRIADREKKEEGKALSLDEMSSRVRGAWSAQHPPDEEKEGPESWPRDVFMSYLIVAFPAGGPLWRVGWKFNEAGEVEFVARDEWEKVEHEYVTKATPSTAIKALGQNRFGGYALVWGSPQERDLAGEYFTPETDLALGWYDRRPALYHHGLDQTIEAKTVGSVTLWTPDDIGLWIEGEWAKHDKYVGAVKELVERGALSWSPGSAPNLVKRAKDGELKRWAVMEFSMTPVPCQPRMTEVKELKAAYKAIGLELEVPDDGDKASAKADGGPSEGDVARQRLQLRAKAMLVALTLI